VYPASFEYCAPTSLAEVSRLLADDAGAAEVKLIAGGQSLLPMLRLRLIRPRLVVDLQRVPGLATIGYDPKVLQLGAMTTHASIEDSAELGQHWPWLAETAAAIGDRHIRNLGTIGGSLAHADPSADWTAMALAGEAVLEVSGTGGARSVSAEPFLRGAYETSLEPSEVVTSVSFPTRQQATGGSYRKFRHPASGYAVAGAAVVLSLGPDDRLSEVRVGITGVASIAYRARAVELALEGEQPTPQALVGAAAEAAHDVEALADTFADAEFRAHLAMIVTERALIAALQRLHAPSA
jgi:aerobic carbon-monoxide dehydrogenase medium subunit